MNKHRAILALMRISAFLQKLGPLMSPTIEAAIQAIHQVVDWLETLPDDEPTIL